MSASKQITLSGLPRGELEALAERLLAENDALRQAVAELKAEVATLKGVKGRPELKPSGMEKGTEPGPPAESRGRGAKAGKAGRLTVDEERVVEAEVPAGSRFKGYEDFLVQDLVLRPHVVAPAPRALAHPRRPDRHGADAGRDRRPLRAGAAPLRAGPVPPGPGDRAAARGPAPRHRHPDLQAPGRPAAERGPGRLPRRGARGAAGRAEHGGLDQRRRHRRPPPAPERRLHPAGQRPLRRLRHDRLEEPAELPRGAAGRLHATTWSTPRRSPTCASGRWRARDRRLGRASRAALRRRGGLAAGTSERLGIAGADGHARPGHGSRPRARSGAASRRTGCCPTR